jgi:HupE/UreJ protein
VKKAILAALMLVSVPLPAAAHPLDIGYLRIDADGRTVKVALDLEVTVAELAKTAYQSAPIVTDAGECVWTKAGAEINRRTATLTGEAECPPGARRLRWNLPFLASMPAKFELFVKAHVFRNEHVGIVDRGTSVVELSGKRGELGFGDLVRSGIAHIGAAPEEWRDTGGFKLPEGIDHILFLLALLLAGGTLRKLLGVATGFTLGHSITLTLAAFDVIRPPASLIEPLIALTIVGAAVEAYSGKLARHRWKIATAFGLIHGFAFASALTELELSGSRMVKALFAYNLGVELGQVAFVLLLSIPILKLHAHPSTARLIVRGAATAIFMAGVYWFVERTLGSRVSSMPRAPW